MAVESDDFYKIEETDLIWWKETPDEIGVWLFSFDRQTVYNLFEDYPWKLTPEQKQIFDQENPYWANFFANRQ